MNILIIEDEIRARSLLQNIVANNCENINQIWEAENLADGVAIIKERKPNLVFLDIEMPNERGTNILKYFETDEIDFEIVFTTAYSEFALKAFEMNAVDYLLKPLRPSKVKEVVARIQESYNQQAIQLKLEELKKALSQNGFDKIALPISDGIRFVPIDCIISLEADGMYTKINIKNEECQLVSKPMKHFEHLLTCGKSFYKPHRSHIFNLKYLKRYVKKDGNFVVLENDQMIPISKDKKDEFLTIVSSI